MTDLFPWFQVVLILFSLGALGAALLTRFLFSSLNSFLTRLEPRGRFFLTAALSVFPLLSGLILLLIGFHPSLLDLFGIIADHCRNHPEHAFHLCFLHFPPPEIGFALNFLTLAILGIFGFQVRRELGTQLQAHRWARDLLKIARFDSRNGTFLVETDRPLAFTTGIFRRRIVVSRHLLEILSPPQLQAVLAHEKAHARRFDGLVSFLLRLISLLHFPEIRDELRSELTLSAEQSCDLAAARAVGDGLTVAEAILRVERAHQKDLTPASILQFGGHGVERRVLGLLNPDWKSTNWLFVGLSAALVLGLLALNLHELHHGLEHALSRLF